MNEQLQNLIANFLKDEETVKNQIKKGMIDFFKNDETALNVDSFKEYLTEEDWQDIANECGKKLFVVGTIVFLEEGISKFKQYTPK